MASMRFRGGPRKAGVNLLPILVYVAVAVVVAGGMYLWDVQHRRAQEAARRPPDPRTIARTLVENIVGSDTVTAVEVDAERKTVAVTIGSVLFRPGRPRAEMRELLEAEATLATGAVLGGMRDIERVTATLVHEGNTLVIVQAERGRDRVTTTIVDERLKD